MILPLHRLVFVGMMVLCLLVLAALRQSNPVPVPWAFALPVTLGPMCFWAWQLKRSFDR